MKKFHGEEFFWPKKCCWQLMSFLLFPAGVHATDPGRCGLDARQQCHPSGPQAAEHPGQ